MGCQAAQRSARRRANPPLGRTDIAARRLRRHPDAGGMGNLLAPPGTVIRAFDTRERDMRRRIARTGARIMATNVVALTQPTNLSDIQADVRNALDARGRLPALLDVLSVQRVDAVNAFLRTFTADL